MGSWIRRGLVTAVLVVAAVGLFAGAADARNLFRSFYGYTGQKTHWAWAGPDVGLIAWGDEARFYGSKGCTSHSARVYFTGAENTSSLHNGAELVWVYSVTRSDGKRFALGGNKTTEARSWWPNTIQYDQRVVPTPPGTWLTKGNITTMIVNTGSGSTGVPFAVKTDSVRFRQTSKWC